MVCDDVLLTSLVDCLVIHNVLCCGFRAMSASPFALHLDLSLRVGNGGKNHTALRKERPGAAKTSGRRPKSRKR
jgi:hypothetical protein